MDINVAGNSFAMSTEVSISAANIMVGDPLELLALSMLGKKRICGSFDDCMISFYECFLQE